VEYARLNWQEHYGTLACLFTVRGLGMWFFAASVKKDRNFPIYQSIYQCKISQKHHCCNQNFWSILSTTFTHFWKIVIKQRSQKTFAYGDTFALKRL
jgi:hypothetical protein